VAGGKAAVMVENKKKGDEVMIAKLGNIQPGQEATLKFTIVTKLEIFGGHYAFTLPAGFYPDYKKHGNPGQFMYDFDFMAYI